MIGNSKKKNGYDDQFGQVLMKNLALGTSGVDLFGNVGTDEAPSSAWKSTRLWRLSVRENANHHGKRNGSCKRIIEPTRFGQLRKAISRVYGKRIEDLTRKKKKLWKLNDLGKKR